MFIFLFHFLSYFTIYFFQWLYNWFFFFTKRKNAKEWCFVSKCLFRISVFERTFKISPHSQGGIDSTYFFRSHIIFTSIQFCLNVGIEKTGEQEVRSRGSLRVRLQRGYFFNPLEVKSIIALELLNSETWRTFLPMVSEARATAIRMGQPWGMRQRTSLLKKRGEVEL